MCTYGYFCYNKKWISLLINYEMGDDNLNIILKCIDFLSVYLYDCLTEFWNWSDDFSLCYISCSIPITIKGSNTICLKQSMFDNYIGIIGIVSVHQLYYSLMFVMLISQRVINVIFI